LCNGIGWAQDIEVNNIFSDEEGRLPLEDAKRLVLKNLRILEVNTSLLIFVLLLLCRCCGSRFNGVPGSVSGSGFAIRI
jgi:hypothetical protein